MNRQVNGKIVKMTVEEVAQHEKDTAPAPITWLKSRRAEFPSLEECIHAILDGDLDTLQAKRELVKAKYPKV